MQLPHVLIAFLAREVRFPHGFIAFSLCVFLGGPRWLPRVIVCDFARPLGASGTLLGSSWGPLSALGPPFGAPLALFL